MFHNLNAWQGVAIIDSSQTGVWNECTNTGNGDVKMFCPHCKTEYRPGFTRCADCGAELVDRLTEEDQPARNRIPDDVRLVSVLSTNDMADVINVKMLLDSEGIEYMAQGETARVIEPVGPVVFLVRESDVERATELLKGIKLNYSSAVFNPKKRR